MHVLISKAIKIFIIIHTDQALGLFQLQVFTPLKPALNQMEKVGGEEKTLQKIAGSAHPTAKGPLPKVTGESLNVGKGYIILDENKRGMEMDEASLCYREKYEER